jgi:hypothetical protein
MSIGSVYTDEEVARRRDCFSPRVQKYPGYFTRQELNEIGAEALGNGNRWFRKDEGLYGLSGVVFEDGTERFRKLLSEKLLLGLA